MKEEIARQFEQILEDRQFLRDGQKLTDACTDFFGNWQGQAHAILYPENTQQVSECLKLCSLHSIPVTVQGGKTGLVAGSVPSQSDDGVILSLAKMARIREIDIANQSVVVEAGITVAELNEHLKESALHFPVSIGSDGSCQIGGIISTNAGGHGVLRYGMTRNQLLGIEAVLADGSVISNLRALRKDNIGYDFGQLLCGAEGTLGVVTAAALKVLPLPQQRVTTLLAMNDINKVIELYAKLSAELSDFLSAFELIPLAARTLVETYIEEAAPPPLEGSDWYVLMQAETTSANLPLETLVSEAIAAALESGDVEDAVIAQSESQRAQMWKFREAVVFSQRKHGPVLPHDLSVRVSKIPDLLSQGREAVSRIYPNVSFITFGHVGDGNLHFGVVHNGPDPAFKETYGSAIEAALCEVVQSLGGSISAEHGIGRNKKNLVHYSRDQAIVDLMQSTRRSFDPNLTLNPDVLF